MDSNGANKDAAREAGAVPALMALIQNGPRFPPSTPATAALTALAADSYDGMEAIAKAGAIPVLIKLLSAGPYQEVTVHAAHTLRELSFQSNNREAIAAAGAIRPLTGLLEAGLDKAAPAAAAGALLSLALSENLRQDLDDAGRQCWRLVDSIKAVNTEEGTRPGARLQAMILIALLYGEPKVGNRAVGKLLNRLDICTHVVKALQAAYGAPDHSYLGVRWTVGECVVYIRWLTDNEDFTDRLTALGAPGVLADVVRTGSGGPSPMLDACVSMVQLGTREAVATTLREAKAAEDALRSGLGMMEAPYRSAMGILCSCDCAASDTARESEEAHERTQADSAYGVHAAPAGSTAHEDEGDNNKRSEGINGGAM